MTAPELQLTYWTDEEWTGQITATVKSGAFSARGSAWFDRTQVKQTFLAALRCFPFSLTDAPMLEGGFWSKENQGTLDQCHLRITIKPYNERGTLLVRVELATESWKTSDADLENRATIRFLTEYGMVDIFAQHLEEVLDGKRDVAVLKGITN